LEKVLDFDVIIAGGGFSGLTAARELRLLGYKVLIIEARERLGGRTWVDRRLGTDLEMGGTYVHWYQPHVWSEITRYGLELTSAPLAEKVFWITGGEAISAPAFEFKKKLRMTVERIMREGIEYIPFPYDPLYSEKLKAIDHMTAEQFLKQFNLSQEEYDILHGWMASDYSGSLEKGAATQILRWWAFSQGNWDTHSAMVSTYRLKKGTKALIDSIANDCKAEFRLGKKVKKIEHYEYHVRVECMDGTFFTGKAAIVTVPLTTLPMIEFSPALSKEKRKSAHEGQTSSGVKVWAKVKGRMEPFDAIAPGSYPLNSVHVDRYVDGDSILVGFGPSSALLNPYDKSAVEKALQYWIPDLEVLECTGHDWVNDEFTKETWPTLRPYQLTAYHKEWNTSEGSIFLAGTTYANGWAGFIDGAIETGITSSRKVHDYLIRLSDKDLEN
jgi:monoamine oxidase